MPPRLIRPAYRFASYSGMPRAHQEADQPTQRSAAARASQRRHHRPRCEPSQHCARNPLSASETRPWPQSGIEPQTSLACPLLPVTQRLTQILHRARPVPTRSSSTAREQIKLGGLSAFPGWQKEATRPSAESALEHADLAASVHRTGTRCPGTTVRWHSKERMLPNHLPGSRIRNGRKRASNN